MQKPRWMMLLARLCIGASLATVLLLVALPALRVDQQANESKDLGPSWPSEGITTRAENPTPSAVLLADSPLDLEPARRLRQAFLVVGDAEFIALPPFRLPQDLPSGSPTVADPVDVASAAPVAEPREASNPAEVAEAVSLAAPEIVADIAPRAEDGEVPAAVVQGLPPAPSVLRPLIPANLPLGDSGPGIDRLMKGDLHPGVARPKQRARLTAPADGRLHAVFIREGAAVQQGAALFQMDDELARAALASAEASAQRQARIGAARAQIDHLEEVLKRVVNAEREGAASGLEVREAEANLSQAQAMLASAEEEALQSQKLLDLERQRLSERTVRAPFAGIIRRVVARPGDMLRGGQDVLQLVALDILEIELDVPLRLADRLVEGEEHRLLAGPPVNGIILARLTALDPVVDGAGMALRAHFEFDNRERRWPAGFFARIATDDDLPLR